MTVARLFNTAPLPCTNDLQKRQILSTEQVSLLRGILANLSTTEHFLYLVAHLNNLLSAAQKTYSSNSLGQENFTRIQGIPLLVFCQSVFNKGISNLKASNAEFERYSTIVFNITENLNRERSACAELRAKSDNIRPGFLTQKLSADKQRAKSDFLAQLENHQAKVNLYQAINYLIMLDPNDQSYQDVHCNRDTCYAQASLPVFSEVDLRQASVHEMVAPPKALQEVHADFVSLTQVKASQFYIPIAPGCEIELANLTLGRVEI